MAKITLQVIEGMEAGRIYRDLKTPIHIGREEENQIQLNDERISRFHAKIQAQGDRFILTDLQSTNGTRVNGHPVQTRSLRMGDQLNIGRCMLVVGAPEELVSQSNRRQDGSNVESKTSYPKSGEEADDPNAFPVAFPHGPPPIPTELNGLQVAEVSDLLEYVRTEATEVLRSMSLPEADADSLFVHVPREAWNRLHQLPAQISRYLRELSDPTEE